jgi:hypothetical protein
MPFVPWMFVVWGVLLLGFIAFKVYVSRMSRNEDNQIILQDSFDNLRQEQAAITARLQGTKPVGYTILGLLGAMTIYIFAYYLLDILRQFK